MPLPRQPGRFRGLASRVLLCLLLGAVLQYAVAAALSMGEFPGNADQMWVFETPDTEEPGTLIVAGYQRVGRSMLLHVGWGEFSDADWSRGKWVNEKSKALSDPSFAKVITKPATRTPPSWSRISRAGSNSDFVFAILSQPVMCFEVSGGWPARSASYFASVADTNSVYLIRDAIVLSNPVFSSKKLPRVIPLSIYWPGTIINTLFYAALLAIPFILAPLLRHHLRRRRGCCIACGYDLQGAAHPNCPECGAAITRA